MDGVSRLLSLLSTTSMPLRRARPTTLVAFPTSMPSTDMGAARGPKSEWTKTQHKSAVSGPIMHALCRRKRCVACDMRTT